MNENEFVGLINDIPYCKNNSEEYIYKFLSIIDPFNNKKITFSECISLFSMEIIEDIRHQNLESENNKENKDINNNKDKINDNNIEFNKNKNFNSNNNSQITLLDKICLES